MHSGGTFEAPAKLKPHEVAVKLECIAEEQQRWGKWNTARLENEAHEIRMALMSPWRRMAYRIGGKIGLAVLFALSYGLPLAAVVKFVVGY